ncbi:MAG: hypothetical protein ACRD3F_16405 [Acidobacteriaceae bacterium]
MDVIEGEFSEEYRAWAIQAGNGKYLVIPDNRFPGRHPIRFFMSKEDAHRVLDAVLDVKPELGKAKLAPVHLPLLDSLRRIASDPDPDHADSFVVHSPNEVYEFVASLKARTIQ